MPDLFVDLAGLRSFSRRLDRICDALDDAERVLRGADDALGDATVVSALHRFEKRWRDGREKVQDNAATLARMVDASVQAFRDADDDLAVSIAAAVR